jgi:hypothetical protein
MVEAVGALVVEFGAIGQLAEELVVLEEEVGSFVEAVGSVALVVVKEDIKEIDSDTDLLAHSAIASQPNVLG